MSEKSDRRELLRLIGSILSACLIGALLAAAAAAVILRYVAVESPDKRYDDVEKILGEYDSTAFQGASIGADGTLSVRLSKEDAYWYASEFGIFQRFEERLSEVEAASGWTVKRYGFHVQGDRLVIHLNASKRLPMYFRAVYDVECTGTVMQLTPVEVAVSGYMELPPERWPSLLPKEGFRLDFAEMGISRCLRSVRLEGDALVLEADGFQQALSGQLITDTGFLRALEAYGCRKLDNWGILEWLIGLGTDKVPMAEAQELILNSGNAAQAMGELLACCTGASRMEVLSGWDRFTLEFAAVPVETAAAERHRALERYIAAEQWKYERLLTSVRELYKSGALTLTEKGFVMTASGAAFDPAELTSSLAISAIDSRPVLLSTQLGGAKNIRTTDMPQLDTLPRREQWRMTHLEFDRIYDVGMLVTTESDTPVLLHYRNDGTFVLREVTQALYTELLVFKGVPVLSADTLWAPAERTASDSVMGISRYEILMLP